MANLVHLLRADIVDGDDEDRAVLLQQALELVEIAGLICSLAPHIFLFNEGRMFQGKGYNVVCGEGGSVVRTRVCGGGGADTHQRRNFGFLFFSSFRQIVWFVSLARAPGPAYARLLLLRAFETLTGCGSSGGVSGYCPCVQSTCGSEKWSLTVTLWI